MSRKQLDGLSVNLTTFRYYNFDPFYMEEEVTEPLMLLTNLDSCLGPMGELKNEEAVHNLHRIMKNSFDKLVSKCIIINILSVTNNESILLKFVQGEGWNLLNKWLKAARENNNGPFLLELLKIHEKMPVSIPLLKTNDTAKVIKQLIKIEWGDLLQDEIQNLSKTIVTNWMNMIQETKLKNALNSHPTASSKNTVENDDSQTSSSTSAETFNEDNTTTPNSLYNPIKPSHRIKKTAKPFQTKLRTIGLEEELKPPSLKGAKQTSKRLPGEVNVLPKKLKHIENYKLISSRSSEDCNPSSTTIPPIKAASSGQIIESTGFMDALDVAATETSRDKQRRLSGSLKQPPLKKTSETKETTSDSRNKSVARTKQLHLPFYQDGEGEEQLKESVVNVNKLERTEDEKSMPSEDTHLKGMEIDEDKMENESGTVFDPKFADSTDTLTSTGPKGILSSAGKTTAKGNKKVVKWRGDSDLNQIYYFELDESERAYVRADHSQFADMKRNELALEKRALQHAKKVTEHFPWKPPALIDGLVSLLTEPGCNSHEKHAQSLRESRALQEIYFDVRSIPDAPKEADSDATAILDHTAVITGENMEVDKAEPGALLTSPIVIPLEDVNNPDNVMDFRNYQIPVLDDGKKSKKNYKLKANETSNVNPPLPETTNTVPGSIPPNMMTSGFGTFPGQMMVPPLPPGTMIPRPPFINAGQNNVPFPGLPPMPPMNPMMVNNGINPPGIASGMMMLNMAAAYRNGPNLRAPMPMYVQPPAAQQQQMQGMLHQMQQQQQQFRMRYQRPPHSHSAPGSSAPPPSTPNSQGTGNPSDERKSHFSHNSSNHAHRPQRPTSDQRPNFKKQVCKHYSTPSGCRFGKNCSFLHIKEHKPDHSTSA